MYSDNCGLVLIHECRYLYGVTDSGLIHQLSVYIIVDGTGLREFGRTWGVPPRSKDPGGVHITTDEAINP